MSQKGNDISYLGIEKILGLIYLLLVCRVLSSLFEDWWYFLEALYLLRRYTENYFCCFSICLDLFSKTQFTQFSIWIFFKWFWVRIATFDPDSINFPQWMHFEYFCLVSFSFDMIYLIWQCLLGFFERIFSLRLLFRDLDRYSISLWSLSYKFKVDIAFGRHENAYF